MAGAQIGRIAIVAVDGAISIELPATQRICVAKLAVAVSAEDLRHAVETRQPVVVVFENGDEAAPIVVGFIAPPAARDESDDKKTDHAPQVIESTVDGRRTRIVAQDEIVFECGAASITLRRNGRVIIRGTHIESHSDGTNRIKGGQVRIN